MRAGDLTGIAGRSVAEEHEAVEEEEDSGGDEQEAGGYLYPA